MTDPFRDDFTRRLIQMSRGTKLGVIGSVTFTLKIFKSRKQLIGNLWCKKFKKLPKMLKCRVVLIENQTKEFRSIWLKLKTIFGIEKSVVYFDQQTSSKMKHKKFTFLVREGD